MRLVAVLRTPHLPQQLALGDELAGVAGERLDQLPLGRREPHVLAVASDALRRRSTVKSGVDRGDFVAGMPTPQRDAESREQLVHAERLRDVVVGAEIERSDLARSSIAPRREDDDRDVGPAPQPDDDVEPADARQPQIEHHRVGVVAGGEPQCILPAGGEIDLVATRR